MKLTGKEQHILICIYRYKYGWLRRACKKDPSDICPGEAFSPLLEVGGGMYMKEKGGPKESMQNKSPRIHGQE